jgi:hypothetical protein
MPVARSLYMSLTKRYGSKKGKAVYYGMEAKDKGSFRKAVATAVKRGHVMGLRKKKAKK